MIIDTHTHFGDPAQPQDLLYRTALPATYKALAIPQGITGTVVAETARYIEDNQWVLDQAADDPFIVGLIGNLDPFADEFGRDLERFAANPLFNGFRLHTSCCRPYAGNPPQSSDDIAPRLLESLELLVARDLALDFHGDYTTLGYAAELVRQVPGLRLVLNHIAEGRPIDGRAPNPEWAQCLREIAAQTEVYCKVSALVQMTETTPAPADVEFYRPTLDVVWNAFGADRVIYASNWPQIERVSDFETAHRIVAHYFESKGSEATEKFFWKNSRALYRWVERK
jgi:L-fuconolactonase